MLSKSALVRISLLSLVPLSAYASDQLIPAGSLVTCRVAEMKISSKTMSVGDPVLCTLDPVERYGRSVFPYGSYIEGRFEDYKDPGHFVGKGWMELKFDKMFTGNRVVPISAKVVEVPKYRVDKDGKILGNGHAVRDTVEWLIPVLWPIDLINLPRRGPYPTLKPETPLTLEVMDDIGIPQVDAPTNQQYPPQQYAQQQAPALIERVPQQQVPAPQPVIIQNFQAPAPQQQEPQVVYVQSPPQTVYVQAPPRVVYRYVAPPPPPPPPAYYAYPTPYGYRYGYGPGY
jgi:hypothetical protein